MKINHSKLKNGLLVVTDCIPGAKSVSINLWVKTGSRFEEADNNGISHFLEHMAFKSTKTKTTKDIAIMFDCIGGNFNACTGRETTTYYTNVLNKDTATALDIISDMLLNSLFLKDELEREKGVVIQEIYKTNDDPSDIIFDKFLETAYPNQQFGRSILGTEELVNSFDEKTLRDYIAKFYKGNNMCLAIAGDVEHDKMHDLAEQFLSAFPTGELDDCTPAVYSNNKNLCLMNRNELDQVNLLLGFEGMGYKNINEVYKQKLMSAIFGGGMSSRLFQSVREQKGLAYSIYSFLAMHQDTGMFSIYSGTSPDLLNEMLDTVYDELKKFCINGPKEEELKIVKSQITSSILMLEDSISSRSYILGNSFVSLDRYITIKEVMDIVNKITIKDIQDMAIDLITKSKLTLACVGKVKDFNRYDELSEKMKNILN